MRLNTVDFSLTISVMVRILSAVIDLTLPESPAGKHLLHLLPPATRARVQALQKHEDISRSLTAYSLLFRFLYDFFGLNYNEVVLADGPYGKPELTTPKEIFFNCTHAGRWALCAVSRYPVGVDIEELHQSFDTSLYSYLHPKEIQYLEQLPFELRKKEFLTLWTMKESYLKALGCGLFRDTSSFAVVYAAQASASVEDPYGISGCTPRLERRHEIPGYAVTTCSMIPDSGENL